MLRRTPDDTYIQQGTARHQEQERLLLRGGEVAQMLGISRALAFRWMHVGLLPTVRMPGCRSVRVPKAALLRLIEQRTQEAVQA